MGDAVEDVLRLVAEGRLTPAEAAPILDALAAGDRAQRSPATGWPANPGSRAGTADAGPRAGTTDAGPRAGTTGAGTSGARTAGAGGSGATGTGAGPSGATATGTPARIRVQVRENGRVVVDLKVPGVLAGLAGSLPGIPSGYADRVREALRTGLRGPIVDIRDEDDSGLTITID